VYGIVSLRVVAVSIISFLAESLPSFRETEILYEIKSLFNVTLNSTITSTMERRVQVLHPVLNIIDLCCMVFFTLEYALRIAFIHKRLRNMRSIMGLVDLTALLQDYIHLIMVATDPTLANSSSTKIITILEITRILRIFRLVRHVPGLWILIYTLKASLQDLLLVIAFLCVGMLIFSSLIYYADDRKTCTSIPHSFWWALITMTTVGYGDMYPVAEWGYVIGSLTAMSGLLMIGFSVPILVKNFIMYYQHVQFALEEEKLKRNTSRKRTRITRVEEIHKKISTKNNNSYC
jgi:hypothetical protein